MIYIEIQDNIPVGATNNKLIADKYFENYITTDFEDYTPANNKYKYENGEIILNPSYESEQAEKEAERIAMLNLTRGDVFRALLLAKGVTREQLRSQLEVMPASTQEETVKRELALIDFDEALDFYRGNPLIDTVGLTLGLTKEQLDRFFETNDYKELVTANP